MGKLSTLLISIPVGILLAFVFVPEKFLYLADWLGPVYGPSFQAVITIAGALMPTTMSLFLVSMALIVGILSRGGKDGALVGFLFSLVLNIILLALIVSGLVSCMNKELPPIPPPPDPEMIGEYHSLPIIGAYIEGLTSGGPASIIMAIFAGIGAIVTGIAFMIACTILSAIVGAIAGRVIKKLTEKPKEEGKSVTLYAEEISLAILFLVFLLPVPRVQMTTYPHAVNENYMELITIRVNEYGHLTGEIRTNDSTGCEIMEGPSTFLLYESGGNPEMVSYLFANLWEISLSGLFSESYILLPETGAILSYDFNYSFREEDILSAFESHGLKVQFYTSVMSFTTSYGIYIDIDNTIKNYLSNAFEDLVSRRGGFASHFLDTPPTNASAWVRMAGRIENVSISAYGIIFSYYFHGNDTHTVSSSYLWNGEIEYGNASYSSVHIVFPSETNIISYTPTSNPVPTVLSNEIIWEGNYLTGNHSEFAATYQFPHPLKIEISREIIGKIEYDNVVTVKVHVKNLDTEDATNVTIDDSMASLVLGGTKAEGCIMELDALKAGEEVVLEYKVKIWSGGYFWIKGTAVTHGYGNLQQLYTIYGENVNATGPRVPFPAVIGAAIPGGVFTLSALLGIGVVLQAWEIIKSKEKKKEEEEITI